MSLTRASSRPPTRSSAGCGEYKKRSRPTPAVTKPRRGACERLELAKFVIEALADDEEEGQTDFAPVVVAEDAQPLKTLSVASAVFELDLTRRAGGDFPARHSRFA